MDSAATESLPHSGQGDDVDQVGRHQSGVFPVYQREDSTSPESRAAVKAFALRHRETSESTRAMIEAFARRIAVAASCLAVGHPTAMLHPDAWRADEFTFERHREPVKLSGAALENARLRWKMWYRFFTANHFQRSVSALRVHPCGPTQLCDLHETLYSLPWIEGERPRRNRWASQYGSLESLEKLEDHVREVIESIDRRSAKDGWSLLSEQCKDVATGVVNRVELAALIERELRAEHNRRRDFDSYQKELKSGSRLPAITPCNAAALLLGVAIGARDDLFRQGIIAPSTSAPANQTDVDTDSPREAVTDVEPLKPVLCWTTTRVDSEGDQRLTRMGEDLAAVFTAVRRWDGSGARARQLAYRHQVGSVGT